MFDYIFDFISGRIRRHNILVSKNYVILLKCIDKYEANTIMKCLAYCCAAQVYATVTTMLNEKHRDYNQFVKHIKLLNQESAMYIFKLVISHVFVFFLGKEDNVKFLEAIKFPKGDVERVVFDMFGYSETEKKDYYDLSTLYRNEPKYQHELMYKAFKNSYHLDDIVPDFRYAMILQKILHHTYRVFFEHANIGITKYIEAVNNNMEVSVSVLGEIEIL